jgi:hypothetical protein
MKYAITYYILTRQKEIVLDSMCRYDILNKKIINSAYELHREGWCDYDC